VGTQPETIGARGTTTRDPRILPDLIVQSIRSDLLDNRLVVYATIRNQGYADAFLPKGWRLAGANFLGDWDSATIDTAGGISNENVTLKRGQFREVEVCKLAGPFITGLWQLTVMADPQKQVKESNENNNTSEVMTIPNYDTQPGSSHSTHADLIITDLWLDPAEATLTGDFEVVAVVKNQGQGAAIISRFNGITKAPGGNSHDVKPKVRTYDIYLQPGQSVEIRGIPGGLTAGTFTWKIRVDAANIVQESNEYNNEKDIIVTIKNID
jgi:hypothetical protein